MTKRRGSGHRIQDPKALQDIARKVVEDGGSYGDAVKAIAAAFSADVAPSRQSVGIWAKKFKWQIPSKQPSEDAQEVTEELTRFEVAARAHRPVRRPQREVAITPGDVMEGAYLATLRAASTLAEKLEAWAAKINVQKMRVIDGIAIIEAWPPFAKSMLAMRAEMQRARYDGARAFGPDGVPIEGEVIPPATTEAPAEGAEPAAEPTHVQLQEAEAIFSGFLDRARSRLDGK